MSALNAALCRCGIILWLAVLLASRSTHSAPVYDQDTTQVAEYDGATAGCYFNFQRYQEGDRIITSEPCLNCTCHNRMLMCYLKVCPFTKAIGQDCTVEKRPDQCCPVITCPEVPVQLLTSTTSVPESTEVGFHDNYGCVVDDRFYADGAQLPVDHHNPCELCYCIRNRTTCVMQECTLRVAGCKPVYQPGICCPIKYNCEYDEESSTTVGSTPGLIMTTTLPPGVLPQCYHEDKVYEDGDLIYSTQPCQHCYCFRGEIACAVQNCGTPMQAHGKNCTAVPPPEGECCPTTYECEEDGQGGIITLPEGEEQLPEQTPHDLEMTESPILIDERQQVEGEYPTQESFPGADNTIPHDHEVEQEGIEGTIEHVTKGHISSTEKSTEVPATLSEGETSAPEMATNAVEKEFTSPREHVIESSSTERTLEEAVTTELFTEKGTVKTEMPMTVHEIEELSSEAPGVELPKEETITTEHVPEEHMSTEESIIEKEHSTPAIVETGQPIKPSVSETQAESTTKLGPEESTSPQGELPAQVPKEVTKAEEITEEGQLIVTETPKEPEISTEIVEKATPTIIETEQPAITTVPEFVTESAKEDEEKVHPIETASDETLATETELPIEEVTVTHEISSTKQTGIESTEGAITEEAEEQPTEKEQRPEEPTSEHMVIAEEHVTVGAKKEDAGLTETPAMSEEPVVTEEQQTEKSVPEIPPQGPTGIPIPERVPEQKAEDKYHVTEDYYDITHPEIVNPDNLVTELPQTTYLSHDQETSLVPSEETAKPEESTEEYLSTEKEPSITKTVTVLEEVKTESTAAIAHSTESSITTVAYEKPSISEEETEKTNVPEEIETEAPVTKVQLTERVPGSEELPAKEPEEAGPSEERIGDLGGKPSQPKKEESSEEKGETVSSVAGKPETTPEKPAFIPTEHSTMPSGFGEEQATEGEQTTAIMPSDDHSTHVPQTEDKEIETTPMEKEKPIVDEKPTEEYVTENPVVTSTIISEEEKEPQTEESVVKKEQTTEMIKEIEEKSTTQVPSIEGGKTEQSQQYSTEKIPEEATVIESHGLQETEVPIIEETSKETEGMEQQTEITVTGKVPSEETGVESTELHPTEKSEGESEEKDVSVPVFTEKVETEISETEFTEMPTVEKKPEVQTEPSVVVEHLPTQPSITDRKEDQEPIEPGPSEGQITQKPSLEEKEVTEIHIEPQKPIAPSEEEETHIPTLEEATESVPPEKPVESAGTTESIGTSEGIPQPVGDEKPEITSEQPEKVVTESFEQEKPTQGSITEQPEVHVRKETETPSLIHEEAYVTPTTAIPEKSTVEAEIGIDELTETAISEGTTKPALISEVSTETPVIEEHTKQEEEIVTESIHSEEELQEITQPSITKEKPSQEVSEGMPIETSTEEAAISEIPKIPVIEEQPQKPETEEVDKETTTEIPVYEQKEHSTIAPEETPVMKIATEVPLKEIPQYSTEYPTVVSEEIPTEKESLPEIPPRPSGIPGEGNCLVEGQSYSNNSAVPPSNACQTSCRCISSIIQCELVQCPAPPAHLLNCMPSQAGDSCCPIYACDSIPTVELESDSHKIEPQTPEFEEGQKTVSPLEISTEENTEALKESSTIAGEITTPELQPIEVTVPTISHPEEEVESTETEKEYTTVKSVESVYDQPTTIEQFFEQHPEEHTVSSVSEILKESTSYIPEEHTRPQSEEEETTEGKISEEEGLIKLAPSTDRPQEETVEEQTSVSDEEQVITSTQVSTEQKPHSVEEEELTSSPKEQEITVSTISTVTEEISIPVQEVSTSVEKEEEVTTVSVKGQEKPEEGTTFKSTVEIEKQPEEKVQLTSEEPISSTVEEHELSTKPEEVTEEQSAKPEVLEEEKTVEPTEYESTSIPEIQPTTEHKPIVTSIEDEHTAQTEVPETQTELPAITSSKAQSIASTVESTTLLHDHIITEETPSEEHTTVQFVETSTEESKGETKPQISVEITKPTEEAIHKISHEETSPPMESTGIETTETTEHIESTESSLIEHEGEPPVTGLPEEKPISPEISTEQPTKISEVKETEEGTEHEKPTESSIDYKPTSTQVPMKNYSEITPETESHTTELSIEEQTIAEEILTTPKYVQEEASEQPVTSIVKEPNLGEMETEHPVIPEAESEAPGMEEQTPKTEEQPVEEHTTASLTPSETPQSGVSMEEITPESVTSQEEQMTEKTIESAKPEIELPDLTEQHTVVPEIVKEVEEEQKPEVIEETDKKKPSTEEEQITTQTSTTEELPVEEHTEQEATPPSEIELSVKVQTPELEATIISKEPEEEDQVTSEVSLPEHPVSEEMTTVGSMIPEEHSIVPETGEKEATHEPEYQTTLSTLESEEVSKPTTEESKVEKLVPEGEIEITTEGPEDLATKVSVEVSSTESEQILPETEKPIQETISPEEQQGETEKPSTETPATDKEEAAHSTAPTLPVETTSTHEEGPLITKEQPTEHPLPSEEETLAPEEIQPSQPEEGEEPHPSISEEPQLTEHHTSTTEPEEEYSQTEQTSEAAVPAEQYPIKISGMPTDSLVEKVTVGPPQQPEHETSTSPEEHVTKTQPTHTELPTAETSEEIPEEGEEIVHPHVDHYPEATLRPETDYSIEGQLTIGTDDEHLRPVNHTMEIEHPYQPDFHERPVTTLAPHIPDYPDQSVSSEENPHFPMEGGSYLNPDEDYDEDDQTIYGPGTCRYGGKVYVSAQQIPRDDPCDFCFCFRSDIICLQQSCPPPIPGCHEEPISGFCCPRYECPVSMATALNLTTTTTTTTTTLPPHFHAHAYKGAAKRSGCQIRGQTYRVGEIIKSASGPCLHCTCGGDGNMKCDPRVCTPEPMLRQMIAAATAKRRR